MNFVLACVHLYLKLVSSEMIIAYLIRFHLFLLDKIKYYLSSWYYQIIISGLITEIVSMEVFLFYAGFIMMCPQLFINYKLQSVAHLPWRQMTYKFLNTIIDDLFAFVIKMPMLHRLSVFRDGELF